MAPKSILKKRALPIESTEVEEVPASAPTLERISLPEPESESDEPESEFDSDAGESFDETDEEDEAAILEMGEGKLKGPKSTFFTELRLRW